MLVMLSKNYTRNALLMSNPSDHAARGVPAKDALMRTPLWSMMLKVFPSGNRHWDPKQAYGNHSGPLALSLPVSFVHPPHRQQSNGHFTP
ncbi:hypothetical protein O181_024808 [Austropuccinia psidii MF-1]|uniref:Uncharacterized protein n=1 Tax=Austropuccinia psidii MF-1 TaxID=1389203 RepID=A0A9Q3GYI8_9BASI|nr:hypothetical protein [Austropuccinia psidii MF-1]